MSDLTFLDNGNPNLHADGLINFSKCRLIYNRIRDLVLRQVCKQSKDFTLKLTGSIKIMTSSV